MKLAGLDWRKILSIDGLLQIFNGCATSTLNKLKINPDFVVSIQSYRMSICDGCDMNNDNQCNQNKKGTAVTNFTFDNEERYSGSQYEGCGCWLTCKTAGLEQSCPLGKWLPVVE